MTKQQWRVYVSGGDANLHMLTWLVPAGFIITKEIKNADLVVFYGGADVDPVLYGEDRHKQTTVDSERDIRDIELFKYAYDNKKRMLGICRGLKN